MRWQIVACVVWCERWSVSVRTSDMRWLHRRVFCNLVAVIFSCHWLLRLQQKFHNLPVDIINSTNALLNSAISIQTTLTHSGFNWLLLFFLERVASKTRAICFHNNPLHRDCFIIVLQTRRLVINTVCGKQLHAICGLLLLYTVWVTRCCKEYTIFKGY